MRYFIVLVLLIFYGVSSSADDSGDRRRGGQHEEGHVPKVFDAQGKFVGYFVAGSGGEGVYLEINGAVVFAAIGRASIDNGAHVSANQWQWSSVGFIPYASSDCSGPPLMFYYSGAQPSMEVRQGTDVLLYVAGNGYTSTVHASSVRQNPTIQQCTAYSYDIPVFQVDPSGYSLTQHYPEPLTIRY
jgi:hypothetical protein